MLFTFFARATFSFVARFVASVVKRDVFEAIMPAVVPTVRAMVFNTGSACFFLGISILRILYFLARPTTAKSISNTIKAATTSK